MTLQVILNSVIVPSLAAMPPSMDTPEARAMLLAIGLQESRFKERIQIINGERNGPARGYWQFERMGGVHGVLNHDASKRLARQICTEHRVDPAERQVWIRLAQDDELACKFARLLLWTDHRPLPKLGDAAGAWDYYLDNWRPGKPHRHTWDGLYAQAMKAVA